MILAISSVVELIGRAVHIRCRWRTHLMMVDEGGRSRGDSVMYTDMKRKSKEV